MTYADGSSFSRRRHAPPAEPEPDPSAKPTDFMSMPIHSLSGACVDLESSGELPLSRAVNALVERHAAGEYPRGNALPEGSPLGKAVVSGKWSVVLP